MQDDGRTSSRPACLQGTEWKRDDGRGAALAAGGPGGGAMTEMEDFSNPLAGRPVR